MRRRARLLGATVLTFGLQAATGQTSGQVLLPTPASAPAIVAYDRARTHYALHCGGCHGTLGLSPPRSVPVLRDRAGFFLCTAEARNYIVQLPNVARALLDDQELAELLNFITFDLGGAKAGQSRPFTAGEVADRRTIPLPVLPMIAQRRRIVMGLIRHCGAPGAMLDYGR